MKVKLPCFLCAYENKNLVITATITISEDDLYHFKCEKGHDNLVELQVFKFELLFESGLCAIKDKYFMESVLSVTAALERFFEFFIKIILRSKNLTEEVVNSSLKPMAKQSERQFGAFLALYINTFSESPKILNPKLVEFRNNVVHKGYLPNESEAIAYAEEVYNTIKASYLLVLLHFHANVMEHQLEIKKNRRIKYKTEIERNSSTLSGMSVNSALTHVLSNKDFAKRTFNDSLDYVMNTPFYH
jgi:hypothetical protein